jgi:hypothetical protein
MFEETDEKARLEGPASAFYSKMLLTIKTPACPCGQITFSKDSKRKEKCYHILTQPIKHDRSSTFSSRTQDR